MNGRSHFTIETVRTRNSRRVDLIAWTTALFTDDRGWLLHSGGSFATSHTRQYKFRRLFELWHVKDVRSLGWSIILVPFGAARASRANEERAFMLVSILTGCTEPHVKDLV